MWSRLLFRVFPPADAASRADTRHRFAAVALVLGFVLSVVTAPLFALTNPAMGLVVGVFGIAVLAISIVFRLTRKAPLAFWSLQLASALLFLFCRWTEVVVDSGWAMWLAVLPLTAMLYGGVRAGTVASMLALAVSLVMLTSSPPGFLSARAPSTLAMLVRVFSFFVAVFVLSAAWHQLREQALAHAEKAARARTLFLANMSHELRTPMNGVLGLTELLLSGELSDEQRTTLGVMQRSGEHLLSLINDVIDFARLDADRMPLTVEPMDVRQVIADTLALLGPLASQRHLTLTSSCDEDVPRWVMGDARRVKQVVNNLVGNALKFTSQGGVSVSIRGGDALTIAVRDTGPGIAPDVQARLFQPFEQAEAETNRRYGGSGLGLALSRKLVETMGGSLALQSTPGEGSTFTVRLPIRASEPARDSAPRPVPATTPMPRDLTVLVVDDNEVNLFVAVALLKKLGVQTVVARSGPEAVAAVRQRPFDAVLMDCHMPELDGLDATRLIRALPAYGASVPVIALTASVLPEEVERCMAAGMNACLPKPITLGALREALTRALPPHALTPDGSGAADG